MYDEQPKEKSIHSNNKKKEKDKKYKTEKKLKDKGHFFQRVFCCEPNKTANLSRSLPLKNLYIAYQVFPFT